MHVIDFYIMNNFGPQPFWFKLAFAFLLSMDFYDLLSVTLDKLGKVFAATGVFCIVDNVSSWVLVNNAFELSDVINNFDAFAAACCIPVEKKAAFFEALKSKEKEETLCVS